MHIPHLPPLAYVPLDRLVREQLLPQLGFFFGKLRQERGNVTLDGVPALQSNDLFLPGKIALGLGHVVLNTPADAPELPERLQTYRDIADLTLAMENQSWGIYYYLLALTKLQQAGLLDRALAPEALATLRRKLDWRTFVREADLTLIDLPTNYYGVAFAVARLRMMLGWEGEEHAASLLDKTLAHYDRYSGEFGFSDETEGEGRFDRYSILLIAEICQRFVLTGLAVPERLKRLLRRAADVVLNLAHASGRGFCFGRSIGPYGDSGAVEILSVAAYLNVLTDEEKHYAYTYACHGVARYLDFWFDPAMHSVDMWGKGRRTDLYRAKHRILGENFSLIHQFISANALWSDAGFEGREPQPDLQAWLARTQPDFSLTWFARGRHERALVICRDETDVFTLPLINGGKSQHSNSPYYPLPFAEDIVAGIADSGPAHAQLLPKFTLADGSQLMGTSFMQRIAHGSEGGHHWVRYEQDALNQLGGYAPVEDARIRVSTRYDFAPGRITRTDTYTPAQPLEVRALDLEFLSFSAGPRTEAGATHFERGRVQRFEAQGFEHCSASPTRPDDGFKSPSGPMKTRVHCSRAPFTFHEPLTLSWSITYGQAGRATVHP
ncbi:hypothetical protein [Roseateles asaccharophilus]|uniref:Heparinase II/III-like protein n=1 Tax=Roseateles asaccharophilus TaxID=582607 RepID=A0ABU2A3X4_9BURK|nr:hypothetical protein [Roseateles asaccharophilus]MDR7331886.1 hypothetical protein [Roseateles asaccharophilus]